jgi:hypothetical protein
MLGNKIAAAIDAAKTVHRVEMTPAAREYWEAIYEKLSEERPGLLGAITARAEAQTVRLALIYALICCKAEIDVEHLKAAVAVWNYCDESVRFVFGELLGDPVADEILRALQVAGPIGMTRTQIRDLFGRNQSANRIGGALAALQKAGRVSFKMVAGENGGRPAEVWHATAAQKSGATT